MSRAAEWARRAGETPEQWLARLEAIRAAGTLTNRDLFVFGVRHRQATEAVGKENVDLGAAPEATGQNTDVFPRQAEPNEPPDSLALVLAKDVYRCLSAEERMQFIAWVRAGCPGGPDD